MLRWGNVLVAIGTCVLHVLCLLHIKANVRGLVDTSLGAVLDGFLQNLLTQLYVSVCLSAT